MWRVIENLETHADNWARASWNHCRRTGPRSISASIKREKRTRDGLPDPFTALSLSLSLSLSFLALSFAAKWAVTLPSLESRKRMRILPSTALQAHSKTPQEKVFFGVEEEKLATNRFANCVNSFRDESRSVGRSRAVCKMTSSVATPLSFCHIDSADPDLTFIALSQDVGGSIKLSDRSLARSLVTTDYLRKNASSRRLSRNTPCSSCDKTKVH